MQVTLDESIYQMHNVNYAILNNSIHTFAIKLELMTGYT